MVAIIKEALSTCISCIPLYTIWNKNHQRHSAIWNQKKERVTCTDIGNLSPSHRMILIVPVSRYICMYIKHQDDY